MNKDEKIAQNLLAHYITAFVNRCRRLIYTDLLAAVNLKNMNAEEIAKAFESVPLVFNGEIPENIKCLYYSGKLIEFTEEKREELTKILKKHDADGDKLVKLYKDWHKKWFL